MPMGSVPEGPGTSHEGAALQRPRGLAGKAQPRPPGCQVREHCGATGPVGPQGDREGTAGRRCRVAGPVGGSRGSRRSRQGRGQPGAAPAQVDEHAQSRGWWGGLW